jgi:two-component system nitrogen regulation sensor histidine kinase GlnL
MTKDPLEQNALFKRILDNANTAMLVFDRQMRLTYLNPAGEMLFALSLHRIEGSDLRTLFASSDKFIGNVEVALASNHPFTERELGFSLPNQRQITADCTVTPLSGEDAAAALLVELTQVDRQLRIAREEHLLAQHSATRDVIRGLAHEIKNPLGGLRGAAQLLQAELEDEQLKEYTGIIIQEADRLQNLMNRMLGPNSLPQKCNTNIHELLERVHHLVKSEIPEGIEIVRDYDPSLPDIYADPDQLIQAVLNLTRNAAQALKDHGTITLRTRIQRQMTLGHRRYKLAACIEVIDDGPGIDAEMQDKIFYPMVTSRADGTGLGLPIAQALINQHGGLIECNSRPGETIFTILLPLEMS